MHRRTQLFGQRMQGADVLRVGVGLHRVGVGDEIELAGEVVEHRQFLGQHQEDVRRVQHVVLARLFFIEVRRQALLDVADGVVAEIPRQPAGEARQPAHRRGLEARLILGDEGQRVGQVVLLNHLTVCFQRQQMRAHADDGARRQSDEGIAAEALAADHRFEQVGIRRVASLRYTDSGVSGRPAFRAPVDTVVALAARSKNSCSVIFQGRGSGFRGQGRSLRALFKKSVAIDHTLPDP